MKRKSKGEEGRKEGETDDTEEQEGVSASSCNSQSVEE